MMSRGMVESEHYRCSKASPLYWSCSKRFRCLHNKRSTWWSLQMLKPRWFWIEKLESFINKWAFWTPLCTRFSSLTRIVIRWCRYDKSIGEPWWDGSAQSHQLCTQSAALFHSSQPQIDSSWSWRCLQKGLHDECNHGRTWPNHECTPYCRSGTRTVLYGCTCLCKRNKCSLRQHHDNCYPRVQYCHQANILPCHASTTGI